MPVRPSAVTSITDANVAALGSVSQATGAALSVAASSLTGFGTAITAGDVTVNGISVGAIGAASSAANGRAKLVNAINNVSARRRRRDLQHGDWPDDPCERVGDHYRRAGTAPTATVSG